jgi:hypothetical protein
VPELRHKVAVFIQIVSPAFGIFYAAQAGRDRRNASGNPSAIEQADKKIPPNDTAGAKKIIL